MPFGSAFQLGRNMAGSGQPVLSAFAFRTTYAPERGRDKHLYELGLGVVLSGTQDQVRKTAALVGVEAAISGMLPQTRWRNSKRSAGSGRC